MLGDNPERSFLGNFGLGSMPNSNFLRWWLKPSRNSLMVQRYKFYYKYGNSLARNLRRNVGK